MPRRRDERLDERAFQVAAPADGHLEPFLDVLKLPEHDTRRPADFRARRHDRIPLVCEYQDFMRDER